MPSGRLPGLGRPCVLGSLRARRRTGSPRRDRRGRLQRPRMRCTTTGSRLEAPGRTRPCHASRTRCLCEQKKRCSQGDCACHGLFPFLFSQIAGKHGRCISVFCLQTVCRNPITWRGLSGCHFALLSNFCSSISTDIGEGEVRGAPGAESFVMLTPKAQRVRKNKTFEAKCRSLARHECGCTSIMSNCYAILRRVASFCTKKWEVTTRREFSNDGKH